MFTVIVLIAIVDVFSSNTCIFSVGCRSTYPQWGLITQHNSLPDILIRLTVLEWISRQGSCKCDLCSCFQRERACCTSSTRGLFLAQHPSDGLSPRGSKKSSRSTFYNSVLYKRRPPVFSIHSRNKQRILSLAKCVGICSCSDAISFLWNDMSLLELCSELLLVLSVYQSLNPGTQCEWIWLKLKWKIHSGH